ncbi:helix-turn-helix domain-containing protein [Paracoccus sp. MKU1]|uniref:helix-turn-helix domain-containing protein n=1 Tax=Paracoccus sp. MKU1 TaxID=1745182 RepID=UPI0007190EA7|nr:helix-turn-helix domain-containing protein [Paracoccus sp. MKU1]KRW96323.1 hypothetical protein AQY21_09680 [Paracoccus sp. MKU1]
MPSASDTDYHGKSAAHQFFDASDWFSAQAGLAPELARAAFALGRLDGAVAALEPEAQAGANRRLALIEVEAMLWAQGTPLRREEIGRDLMEARAGADLEAMRLARWGIRRLEGQGDPRDLRGFLGLHRAAVSGLDELLATRPTGRDFDAAVDEFRDLAGQVAGLAPLVRAAALRVLWRLCGLSAPEVLAEPATWTARDMAEGCEALRFVPLGRHGRAVWVDAGPPAERMARHLAAVTAAIMDARHELARVADWQARALAAMAGVKGDNPGRVIRALAAHPLLNAAMLEDSAGISRDTAERMLARMKALGLAREITGGRRFRLWMLAG